MFTGIVTDLGRVSSVAPPRPGAADTRLRITTAYPTNGIAIGASIACNGCCLTVVEKGADWFAVDVSNETLGVTTLKEWTRGTPVNLERALKLGDELGGHLVSGHVDGLAVVAAISADGGSKRIRFDAPPSLARFIAAKGSVAVDGVSLTVNEVNGNQFGVNVIPHTLAFTTLGTLKPGARVNVEIDLLARYVARLSELGRS
jgi:riboflavin synthase